MRWPSKPKRRVKSERAQESLFAALDIGARLSQFVNREPHVKLHTEPDAL